MGELFAHGQADLAGAGDDLALPEAGLPAEDAFAPAPELDFSQPDFSAGEPGFGTGAEPGAGDALPLETAFGEALAPEEGGGEVGASSVAPQPLDFGFDGVEASAPEAVGPEHAAVEGAEPPVFDLPGSSTLALGEPPIPDLAATELDADPLAFEVSEEPPITEEAPLALDLPPEALPETDVLIEEDIPTLDGADLLEEITDDAGAAPHLPLDFEAARRRRSPAPLVAAPLAAAALEAEPIAAEDVLPAAVKGAELASVAPAAAPPAPATPLALATTAQPLARFGRRRRLLRPGRRPSPARATPASSPGRTGSSSTPWRGR